MAKPTFEEFQAVVSNLKSSDFTTKGLPKMDALNSALKAAGHDAINAAERDTLWDQMPDDDKGGDEDPVVGKFVITDAQCSPVIVSVGGKILGRFRVGVEYEMTASVVEALNNSSAVITEA